jgi:hypothetical protein
LHVYRAGGVRQNKMHTACAREFSILRLRLQLRSLKGKSPSLDQIPGELIQAGEETLCPKIHKLIKIIWNKQELLHQWKESIVVTIHNKGDKTNCSNYPDISCCQLHKKNYTIFL